MEVELKMYMKQDGVMVLEKLVELTRKAKEIGFTIGEIEIESEKDKKDNKD